MGPATEGLETSALVGTSATAAIGGPRPEQEAALLAGAKRATGPEPDTSLYNLLLNGCIVKPPPYISSGLRRWCRLAVTGASPRYRGRRRPYDRWAGIGEYTKLTRFRNSISFIVPTPLMCYGCTCGVDR